eukprot:TRINITY_DN60208_c0_g1_i1.p2 TRINITY_DN60208_c0_g1~~TRINITY_DN60208_c0_g1_i1.p2  ORF type:complete len:468 (+),score=191.99 TRINITY_DN60208_c0_g1_i1:68-1471(+)
MAQLPADDHLRATLKDLKATGAFTRDASGNLRDLDPAIASDLIDGEKPALLPVGAPAPVPGATSALAVPRRDPPLPTLGRDAVQAPGGSSQEPRPRRGSRHGSTAAPQRHTEEFIATINRDIEHFNVHVVENFDHAKHNMQHKLLHLFDQTSREKLPDSFLKSLPKWGKSATKLHELFSKQGQETKQGADGREIPFDLVVQPEVLEEVGQDIHDLIDGELKQCCGESGIIIQDMQRIFKDVAELMKRLREGEHDRQSLQISREVLSEQLQDKNAHNEELKALIGTLHQEMRAKDMEQERLRDKHQRQIEEHQAAKHKFIRDVTSYKFEIIGLQRQYEEAVERAREQRAQAGGGRFKGDERRESGASPPMGGGDAFFDLLAGSDGGDAQQAAEEAERRIRADFDEQIRAAVKRERDTAREEKKNLQIRIDEMIEECKNIEAENRHLVTEHERKAKEVVEIKERIAAGQ